MRSISSSAAQQALGEINHAGPSRPRPSPIVVSHPVGPPSTNEEIPPSAPALLTRSSVDPEADVPFFDQRAMMNVYTYKPSATQAGASSQPSPLPSTSSSAPSLVLFNYASVRFDVAPGDYFEIRPISRRPAPRVKGEEHQPPKTGGEALRRIAKGKGRDGYVFRAGENAVNVPIQQIQVPDSVANAFSLQHRVEVEFVRLPDPASAYADHIELRFSQYLGRADMWRLGMSLESQTVHVGEKISLAGGAIRAEVHAVWRGGINYSSGIITSKTKTIYRSRSAQVYIFIQLCEETWQFDEDGERYYEKIVHGFLPDLFNKWAQKSASHLVTIILFARVYYHPGEISYLQKHGLTAGLIQDYAGRSCKDFFRVVIDFERRSDWLQALPEIKRRLERSEREIIMDVHREWLEGKEGHELVQKRLLGKWSFAYEGNVLEAVNLALNPFDEHYVDRDLSRTGLCMTVVTPGTGHFAVDKNLLRLTTERMVDHGFSLDLVCLTKMPLHSVPLFSYVSQRPRDKEKESKAMKAGATTPDLLYFDAHLSSAVDVEMADCYCIPKWVNASFFCRMSDKPFRNDRFIPRCKMYEIQMLGILDHNLTTVTVPLLEMATDVKQWQQLSPDERKRLRDEFDAATFGAGIKDVPIAQGGLSPPMAVESKPSSLVASYQSARLVAAMSKVEDNRAQKRSKENRSDGDVGAEGSPKSPSRLTVDWSPSKSPHRSLAEVHSEPLDLQRTEVRPTSPVPSTLSMRRTMHRPISPQSTLLSHGEASNGSANGDVVPGPQSTNGDAGSGQSTPKVTPGRRLRNQSSRGSFVSRLGPSWLFGSITTRATASIPKLADATVEGQFSVLDNKTASSSPSSPAVNAKSPPVALSLPVAVPGAVEVQPPTPSPMKDKTSKQVPSQPQPSMTQPVPIAQADPLKRQRSQPPAEEEVAKSFRNSVKFSRSPGDSWGRAADLGRASRHVIVNPCYPKDNIESGMLEGRRWQHIRPKPMNGNQHLMKWTSLIAPACLPLTTDYLPTTKEIQEFYILNSYDIACFSDQISFLIRPDLASSNQALAVMREMASQRLSQNFQYIVLPHDTEPRTADLTRAPHRKILSTGESMADDLKIGGASEALRDADSVIYLLLSHHIHRLSCDTFKQSVTVQRFVRRIKYSTEPALYKCLVWPAQMRGFQEAEATFKYPNIEDKVAFNYLDRLINGDEREVSENVMYWRTRYLLIPSGKDPSANIANAMPKGESFESYEVLSEGAFKVLDVFNKLVLRRSSPYYQFPGTYQHQNTGSKTKESRPLKLIPTTWDPSACVLDEGLMAERERVFRNEEVFEKGKRIEGLMLAQVAEMMCRELNGLVIRDRWWHCEQFCEWLLKTFEDIKSPEAAADMGRSLFDKGLIEHVTGAHGFDNYGHIYYRLRPGYDKNAKKRRIISWFSSDSTAAPGTSPAQAPQEVIERHAKVLDPRSPVRQDSKDQEGGAGSGLAARPRPGASGGSAGNGAELRKKSLRMSQSAVIDLDPNKRSDRAEVALLHTDIIHNTKNALHFELNWLGVTAGLLDDLRSKCSAQAERYGLRFIEAPVEEIRSINRKCAYRAAIPIPLALEPPVIPDLIQRLQQQDKVTGLATHWFEYKILTEKFGFVLDVEAHSRYPASIEAEYLYRSENRFEYSQFCHRSGLALVQCVGGSAGYLWADNRLFISSPGRGTGRSAGSGAGGEGGQTYPMAPVPRLGRSEEARQLREDLERFCSDPKALRRFYDEITPPPMGAAGGGEAEKGKEVDSKEKTQG